jgi:very-short-patch-repair endonuclease
LAEALVRRLTTRENILALVDRHPTRSGVTELRALLDEGAEAALTRSEAERRFRELIANAKLPKSRANVRVVGRERDCVWRQQRLVAEIDGFRFHSSRRRFERDRSRDAELIAAGFRVVRITWRQLETEPDVVIARIAQALVR